MTSRFDGVTEHYLASVVSEGLAAGPVTKAELLARALQQRELAYPQHRIERFINDVVDLLVRMGEATEHPKGSFSATSSAKS